MDALDTKARARERRTRNFATISDGRTHRPRGRMLVEGQIHRRDFCKVQKVQQKGATFAHDNVIELMLLREEELSEV